MPEPPLATLTVNFPGASTTLRYFAKRRTVLADIFQGRTYRQVAFLDDVQVIVDAGASVGAASLYFHHLYPQTRIYAFEPQSLSYRLLQENTAGIAQIKTANIGLSDTSAEVPLYLGLDAYSTSSVGTCDLNSDDYETITLRPAAAVLSSEGVERIDILKIDTEGCEVPILRSVMSAYKPRVVYFEYHSDEDRRMLDHILGTDYLLYSGVVSNQNTGEFCYVAKSVFPSQRAMDFRKVVTPSSAP